MGSVDADRKLLIIGLDGATWRVIHPLIKKGQLPNLNRLIQEGTSGNLRSLEPMISAMLWTTISSGKLPDKHGVRDFAVSSKAVRCKRLWNIFEQQALTVGVYGHMITWPPDPVKGFIVPGSFAMGPETHPPDLAFVRKLTMDETSETKRRYTKYMKYGWQALRTGARSATLWKMAGHLAREWAGHLDPVMNPYWKRLLKLRLDVDVFCHLCRKYNPHFSFFYTHLLDFCQHLFWKFMDPAVFPDVDDEDVVRYGTVIQEAYRQVDRAVGRILATMGDGTNVMVISDHGGQAASGGQEGSALTIKTERLLRLLGLWEQVRAVNIGFKLYLCPKGQQSQEKARIIELFQGIVEQETKAQIFQVIPMEYSYLRIQIPDDTIQQLRGSTVRIGEVLCPFEEIVDLSPSRVSGNHHPDGICILWGKSIKTSARLREASILDVTPTALMLMNLPVARDMDGRVLDEAITEHVLQSQPITYRESYENGAALPQEEAEDGPMPEELAKKLRALGYLG
jgi:predicted AlkP superfamily phosphohydrolase/phosphomutase